jgi:Zn-dependent protease
MFTNIYKKNLPSKNMINRKEIAIILSLTIILGFTVAMFNLRTMFVTALVSMLIIIVMNILTKKAAAHLLDSEIEIKLWEIKRFGFKKHLQSKKPFAIGIFLPLLLKVITVGLLNWTAVFTFNVKAKIYRAAKRHGLYAFTEMSEAQIGVIAASGIFMNLILAVIGYFAGFEEFAKLSIGFAFFNMLPISDLDGNKIFFGSTLLWTFLVTIVLLGVLATIFIV